MASHEAARRAVEAGYTDVSVMADGITGWRKAGKPAETPEGVALGGSL
jgi:rhodanese-related sulfurtransferase